ncbi:glycosyltransferase [Phycisphaera mikurensis]|uniref:Glycosyltransferase n=1 Tax=Phycisphaera mikurensis (strain NBRC 102666 / KCTC 22515 / FYK2301M01) TaxID=1142394 RepID=I0IBE7_PHYMF|nr:glycosyltransferase [Phycisphaera mikurensis]MBB6442882.1 glycosyltransferase involved in cell wall biosynthesis [Phycisphaera mikurensis]BAM02585.1 hypothetical protein PSMK_04260 [Phycisphaera mikurensis NBRC 102666]
MSPGEAAMPRGSAERASRCVYYPRFRGAEALTSHFHRAGWYLPHRPGVCDRVTLGVRGGAVPGAAPWGMVDARDAGTSGHLEVTANRTLWLRRLLAARVVLVWDRRHLAAARSLCAGRRVAVVNVDTHDPAASEWGAYAGLHWRALLGRERREALIVASRRRFEAFAAGLRDAPFEAAVVYGTGPSLRAARRFDAGNAFRVVCNSTVQDDALLDHVRPHVITAGDALSHFGVSRYAERFRADLVRALRERDLLFFGTATFASLLLAHHPEIEDKVVLVEQRRAEPNHDLFQRFEAPALDSTMNIHMLPLAATFAGDVFVLGADGQAPAGENEDFWAHAGGAQYHGLVDTGHACHPTFAKDRSERTYARHLASVEATLSAGERHHAKRYACLHPSHIPAMAERALDDGWLAARGLSASAERPVPIASLRRFLDGDPRWPDRGGAGPTPGRARTAPEADRAALAALRGLHRGRAGRLVGGTAGPGPGRPRTGSEEVVVAVDAADVPEAAGSAAARPGFHATSGDLPAAELDAALAGRIGVTHAPAGSAGGLARVRVVAWDDLGPVTADPAAGPLCFSDDLTRGGFSGSPLMAGLQLAAHLGLDPIRLDGWDRAAVPARELAHARAWARARGVRLEGLPAAADRGLPAAPGPAVRGPRRRVAVVMRNPARGYSGGRYHAWFLAAGLVRAGHRVRVLTDRLPAFLHEIPPAELAAMDVVVSERLEVPRGWAPDLVVLVPGGRLDRPLETAGVRLARDADARLALLNFESADWFNALAPARRDASRWGGWRYVASHADLVLSSAREGTRFARRFYREAPAHTLFREVGPPIHDAAAQAVLDAAPAAAAEPGRPRIVCITRFAVGDPHKGGAEVAGLFGPELAGAELCLIVGRDGVPDAVRAGLDAAAEAAGMAWSLHEQVDDAEKFRLLHHGGRPSVLVFPSRFEGFGYPPVEALFLGVPAVAYRLPVLEEVTGGLVVSVEPGDVAGLRRAAAEALAAGRLGPATPDPGRLAAWEDLRDRASLGGFARRIDGVVAEVMTRPAPPAARGARLCDWPEPRRDRAGPARPRRPRLDPNPSLYIRARRVGGAIKRRLGMPTSLSREAGPSG